MLNVKLGASLTNGTSAQATALNSLVSINSLNPQNNQQQMSMAQLMLSQLGYSIPPLNSSSSQAAQSNNFLAGLSNVLNSPVFNLPQAGLNNLQPSTTTNSSLNSMLNNGWPITPQANLNTALNNNNDINLQNAFLQSLLLPTVSLYSKIFNSLN